MIRIAARCYVGGEVSAPLTLLQAALSFYGGYDPATGTLIDATHPDRGISLRGSVLAMAEARGSSSSSSALVEAARLGTAPAAIILQRADPILVIGGLVAADLYGVEIPMVVIPATEWARLRRGSTVRVSGRESVIEIEEPSN